MDLHAKLGIVLTLALLVGGACGPTDTGDDTGGLDASTWEGGGEVGPIDQPPPENCSEAAKLVYVVDSNNTFSSFDPHPTPPVFHDLGTLTCPAGPGPVGGTATPFSMSVDRDAVAWVLYNDGELFRVETANPSSSCTKVSAYQLDQQGMHLYGMGFVANAAGSLDDTLFIAGGAGTLGENATLGTLDMSSFVVTPLGGLIGSPELTGTGNAELWGFFPDTTPPKVAKLDKTSGAELVTWTLATLQGVPAAWAFAFWGGDYWVFLKRQNDAATGVYRVSGQDGTMTVAIANTGREIVGAGVSTCAPVVID
jgi:hypothetical protein